MPATPYNNRKNQEKPLLPKIMIIDDEEEIRRALVDYLDDYEVFHLRSAECAESALQALEQELADLCVVDVRLPGMSGYEFAKATWSRKLCSRYIFHTGSIGAEVPADIKVLGIPHVDLLHKPCDNDIVMDRIHTMLDTPNPNAEHKL